MTEEEFVERAEKLFDQITELTKTESEGQVWANVLATLCVNLIEDQDNPASSLEKFIMALRVGLKTYKEIETKSHG